MIEDTTFEPNWTVPPGATIAAILAARSLSREAFAASLGETVDTVHRLLLGLEAVDAELAVKLSRCLGSSQAFWINREAQYRGDIERVRRSAAYASREVWVKQFPVREMASLGWIGAIRDPADAAEKCLEFFGVRDVAAWQSRYGGSMASAAFRMSSLVKTSPGAVSAWLRWAELVAGRIPCAPWDAAGFRERLGEVRRLTWQRHPGTFLPRLRRLCADVGVAVVVARTPKGCPASGATRFLAPTKALMVLSFRYRSDDQFWFTFFHEAGHLLLHGPDALFLEDGSGIASHEEEEASVLAQEVLIPLAQARALLDVPINAASIFRFARQVGVAPGLIVGQLQHRRLVRPDRLNHLKRHYAWDDIKADRLIP